MSSKRIILGIDPGLADLGWGIVKIENTRCTPINYGSIKTKSDQPLLDRLLQLHENLSQILEKYHPSEVAIEELFFGKNAKTAMKVGEARGVILLTLAQHKFNPINYKPSEIKIALTGYGNADKKQIQLMVQKILKLKEVPKPDDAADALAIALTSAFTNLQLKKL